MNHTVLLLRYSIIPNMTHFLRNNQKTIICIILFIISISWTEYRTRSLNGQIIQRTTALLATVEDSHEESKNFTKCFAVDYAGGLLEAALGRDMKYKDLLLDWNCSRFYKQ